MTSELSSEPIPAASAGTYLRGVYLQQVIGTVMVAVGLVLIGVAAYALAR